MWNAPQQKEIIKRPQRLFSQRKYYQLNITGDCLKYQTTCITYGSANNIGRAVSWILDGELKPMP